VIYFIHDKFLTMLREESFSIPLNPPFIKGDKGMNRMVHAKGGFMVIKKYFSVSAVKQD
jgi:hypothetical protein